MRGDQGDLTGRFTTTFEVKSIGGGITQDLQNPVGQSVLWWHFDPAGTLTDPTYDVGNYWTRGRVWFTPHELPVVLASIEQGPGGHTERGMYTVDMLRLVINTPEFLPYLPDLAIEPDKYLNDRIEYRGGLFQPTTVMPKGHVRHSMVVVTVIAEQIKDDQVVNDSQFNGSRAYPSPFSEEFNSKHFESEVHPPVAEFNKDFDAEDFDSTEPQLEPVEHIERHGHDHVDIYDH
jgi:hypothetical protein